MAVPIEAQIRCVEREIRMRKRVYPSWVERGRMTQAKAEEELEAMEAVLATLQAAKPPPPQGSLLG